jgi:hypothetical protein
MKKCYLLIETEDADYKKEVENEDAAKKTIEKMIINQGIILREREKAETGEFEFVLWHMIKLITYKEESD